MTTLSPQLAGTAALDKAARGIGRLGVPIPFDRTLSTKSLARNLCQRRDAPLRPRCREGAITQRGAHVGHHPFVHRPLRWTEDPLYAGRVGSRPPPTIV